MENDTINCSKVKEIQQECLNEIRTIKYSCQNHIVVINPVSNVSNGGMLHDRKKITKFSESSGSRMRRYLRCCRANYKSFITLTYPEGFPLDGRESKEHLRRFNQELKRRVEREHKSNIGNTQRFSLFWFMEFQERGAIHYHMFCTHDFNYKYIANLWYEIVESDDIRHKQAGTSIERIKSGRHGTSAYASKYAAKQSQKIIPDFVMNAGRFWGICGDRVAMAADTVVTPSIRERPSIRKLLERIDQRINHYEQNGELSVIKKAGGTFCAYMRTERAINEINGLFKTLERRSLMYCVPSSYNLPEHTPCDGRGNWE